MVVYVVVVVQVRFFSSVLMWTASAAASVVRLFSVHMQQVVFISFSIFLMFSFCCCCLLLSVSMDVSGLVDISAYAWRVSFRFFESLTCTLCCGQVKTGFCQRKVQKHVRSLARKDASWLTQKVYTA